jgi:branched-chain amino acid transport system permease protein
MIVGWSVVALATLFVRRIIASPWGRALKAIREDEDAAASIGKNAFRFKLQALTIGGAIAGLAGILLGIEQQNVTPDAYLPQVTFILYVIVILGGAATILGPIVGAVVFQFLFFTLDSLMAEAQANVDWVGRLLSPSDAAQVKFVLVGAGLMLLMVFRPQGILGNREETLIDDR